MQVGFVLGGFALLPLTPATGQNTAALPAPTLPTVSITLQAKKTSLANAMQELAARYHLNYVMCEAPQPEVKADFALEHRTLKDSLDTLCKPFDFQWHMGPGGVLLLEGKYVDLNNLPPLTRGEVWAVLQDFQEIARPFRIAKGDAIPQIEHRLTDSLTLAQWKTLREQGPMGGLGFNELTRDQQNDLIAYVTSQEFDFFVVDLEKAVYFQSLTVDANTLQVLVVPRGAPDPQTGWVRDTAWITTRYTWRGEVRYGIGCRPDSPDSQFRAATLPAYPSAEPTATPPTPIEHTPPLPPAVRRYMRLDHVPAEITLEALEALKSNGGYNWKLTRAAESALRRLYIGNLPQYGKGNVVLWNALPRASQTDLLSFRLYDILAETRVLSKGMPGYVADPTTDVIRFANDRMDLLNLEICGRSPDSKFNSGISLNNKLSPQKRAALKEHGLLTDKP